MNKFNSILLIFYISIIGGCGFHTPYINTAINADIISKSDSLLAEKLRKRFNSSLVPSFTIELSNENNEEIVATYDSSGAISGYNYVSSVQIKVLNSVKEIVVQKDFKSTIYSKKLASNQSNQNQKNAIYSRLADNIVRKFLRILNKLNESK